MVKRPKKTESVGGLRYDLRVINSRIERMRAEKGVTRDALCEALGIKPWDYSRKVNLDRSRFSIEEISMIADHLGAPVGWPFIDSYLGVILERVTKDAPAEPVPTGKPPDSAAGE